MTARRQPGWDEPAGGILEEVEGWKLIAETPRGVQGFGVLLAQAGDRWRARIVTFPRTLWTAPGGRETMKFFGRTAEEAEREASNFIRRHCISRGYLLRDELELVDVPRRSTTPVPVDELRDPSAPRHGRELPVRFGKNRPTVLAETGNLSETGMFVKTTHPMPEGWLLGLLLELEYCKVPLRASVIWSRIQPSSGRPKGMGLKLLSPPREYVRYVHALDA